MQILSYIFTLYSFYCGGANLATSSKMWAECQNRGREGFCNYNITNGHLHSMLINMPSSKMWAECQNSEHILHPALDKDLNVKHVETNWEGTTTGRNTWRLLVRDKGVRSVQTHRKYMKGECKDCGIELKRNDHMKEHIKMVYFLYIN